MQKTLIVDDMKHRNRVSMMMLGALLATEAAIAHFPSLHTAKTNPFAWHGGGYSRHGHHTHHVKHRELTGAQLATIAFKKRQHRLEKRLHHKKAV